MVVAEKTKHLPKKSKNAIRDSIANIVVDTSQNPCRRNFTSAEGNMHTLCTSSSLYHFGRDSAILPCEMMFLQGHNPMTMQIPHDMKAGDLRKLAGEGMPLPSLALCVWAQFLTKGFPSV
jgi:hypothetical protein